MSEPEDLNDTLPARTEAVAEAPAQPETPEELVLPPVEVVPYDEGVLDHPFLPSLDRRDVRAFLKAFAKAQSQFEAVVRNRTVKIQPREGRAYEFTYAELANVLDATKALSRNGISVSQPLHQDQQGKVWLYTILAHEKGAGRMTRLDLGIKASGDLKIFGGIVSYLRRYCYAPAVGVASEDDADQDGSGAGEGGEGGQGGSEKQSTDKTRTSPVRAKGAAAPATGGGEVVKKGQAKNLEVKIKALGLDEDQVKSMLESLGVPSIDDNMLLADWQKVKAELDRASS